jgi:hypothetical protein
MSAPTTPSLPDEFFAQANKIDSQHGKVRWYYCVIVNLAAMNYSDVIPQVWEHLWNNVCERLGHEERFLVAQKVREALIKACAIMGPAKVSDKKKEIIEVANMKLTMDSITRLVSLFGRLANSYRKTWEIRKLGGEFQHHLHHHSSRYSFFSEPKSRRKRPPKEATPYTNASTAATRSLTCVQLRMQVQITLLSFGICYTGGSCRSTRY